MHVNSDTTTCTRASQRNHSNISLFHKMRFPTWNCSPWPVHILLAFTRTFQIQHPCQPYQMTSQQDEQDEIAPQKYVMFIAWQNEFTLPPSEHNMTRNRTKLCIWQPQILITFNRGSTFWTPISLPQWWNLKSGRMTPTTQKQFWMIINTYLFKFSTNPRSSYIFCKQEPVGGSLLFQEHWSKGNILLRLV